VKVHGAARQLVDWFNQALPHGPPPELTEPQYETVMFLVSTISHEIQRLPRPKVNSGQSGAAQVAVPLNTIDPPTGRRPPAVAVAQSSLAFGGSHGAGGGHGPQMEIASPVQMESHDVVQQNASTSHTRLQQIASSQPGVPVVQQV
jgi:hypothetical protein